MHPTPVSWPPKRRWTRWAIELLAIALVIAGVTLWQARSLLPSGEAAPAFSLSTLAGETLSIDALRGRKTLLVFWAPWCSVCGAESDNLSRVGSWLGERVQVVSVALSYEERAEVEAFVREQEVDYPVLLGDAQVARDYQVTAFPTLYVIDAEGRVRYRMVGYTTTFGMLWRALL